MLFSFSRHCFRSNLTTLSILLACSGTLQAQTYKGNATESPGREKLDRPTPEYKPSNQMPVPQINQAPAQRPAPEVMQQPENPELDRILTYWEYLGTKTTKLEGKHNRFTYDFTFDIQKRASGEWYYETPDKGRLDINPSKLSSNDKLKETVNHVDEKGQIVPHEMNIEADTNEAWICDGKVITLVHVDKKEYEKLPIPAEAQGKAIEDGPLPFLFGISAQKAKQRYRMELLTPDKGGKHDLAKGIIHIVAYPLWRHDANNFTKAEVILDSKTFFPSAIKLVHPGEKQWTVYTFYDVKRNAQRGVFKFWEHDPFAPSLAGMKELKLNTAPQGVPPTQVANPGNNNLNR